VGVIHIFSYDCMPDFGLSCD